MLKKRLIAILVVKDNIVVQSILFRKYLPVGRPEIAVEFLNNWGIDEIILLDIDASPNSRGPNFELIKKAINKCFVPFTVGGGIHSLEDMKALIKSGADKIAINSEAVHNPEIIKQAAEVLGDQCVVVSIDVKHNDKGKYEVFINSGKTPTGINPVDFAKKVAGAGAGEILLNSIERDGSKEGYDLDLVRMVSAEVSIPVIACGGVGHPRHFLQAFQGLNLTAAAAGNYFHFTEHSPIVTKSFLRQNGIDMRMDTYATYTNFPFDAEGRLDRKDDRYLHKIKFEYEPQEVI